MVKILTLLIAGLTLGGCGGGGSSISTGVTTSTGGTSGSSGGGGTTGTTTVVGTVAKGIFTSGTVRIYRVDPASGAIDQSISGFLQSTAIQPDGSYSANLGTYSGPIYLEAFGRYQDEANPTVIGEIQASSPLKAAVANANGTTIVAITPLTSVAVKRTGTLTPTAITAANALISDLFKVDIINTRPVKFDISAINAAEQKVRDYTLELAAVSKLAGNLGSVDAVINYLASETSQDIMTAASATAFKAAVAAMKPAVSAYYPSNSLEDIGSKTILLKIIVDGPPATYMGLDLTIQLPAAVSVKYQGLNNTGTSTLVAGELITSGAASGTKFVVSSYQTPSIANSGGNVYFSLANSDGLPPGEVASLRCYYKPGTLPDLSAFSLPNFKPVDGAGIDLSKSAGFSARLSL